MSQLERHVRILNFNLVQNRRLVYVFEYLASYHDQDHSQTYALPGKSY